MNELKKLLEQMYHAADNQIPDLANAFFLHISEIYTDNEYVKGMNAPVPTDLMLWDEIRYRLVTLRRVLRLERKKNPILKDLFRIINDFEKEAEKRGKHLDEIGHILSPDSVGYYLKLTNINPNTFRTKIRQFWDKLDTPENQKHLLKKSPFGVKAGNLTKQSIDQEMKLISFNISLIEGEDFNKGKFLRDEFEALYAAISQYYRHQMDTFIADKRGLSHSRVSALKDFENCSLCWRFVPKKGKGDNRKPYCGFHIYDPASEVPQTEYNLALKFEHNKPYDRDDPEPPPPLPGTATEIYKQLHEHFPVKDGDMSRQEWTDALCRRFSRIDVNSFPDIVYDLEPLWRICPNVHRFIIEHKGDDKSPESILNILDPETPDEAAEFRQERACMHKFLSKNFALYRLELAVAESYLSEYYQYLDAHPHGGRRPNSGGLRPGAGRKRKNKQVS